MYVGDYMTPRPHTARPDTLLIDAQESMSRHRCHHLPVVEGEDVLVGIVSDRDIRSATSLNQAVNRSLTVGEVMTIDPRTLSPGDRIEEALSILSAGLFSAIPVVERINDAGGRSGRQSGGQLVGILTTIDLLRALRDTLGVDRPGRRIDVELPGGCADVVRVFDVLSRGGHDVLGATMLRRRNPDGPPSLVVRVPEHETRAVEHALLAAGCVLSGVSRVT